MTPIEAVYQNGVFKPIGEVKLAENQRVKILIEPSVQPQAPEPPEWLARAQAHQREFVAKYGYLPDSTPLIAEDRRRDV
jgi:predicted DNA-binding antitoxin AbrB/MazE fold protein